MIFRSKTEFQTTGSIGPGASAFSVDKPAGVQDGDLLVILAFTQELLPFHNVRAVPAASAGVWTQLLEAGDHFIVGNPNSPFNQPRGFWYVGYRVAASEPANWEFDTGPGGTPPLESFGVVTACLAYQGGSTAILDTYDFQNQQGSGPYTSPTLTPSAPFDPIPPTNFTCLAGPSYGGAFMSAWLSDGDLVQIGGACEVGAAAAEHNNWTAPGGYTSISDINQPTAPANGFGIGVAFQSGPTVPPAGHGVSFDGVSLRAAVGSS